MNRETRTFIWGLIIVIFFQIGALAVRPLNHWQEWILYIICIIMSGYGFNKIIKTVD